jgi:hypothetical protein
MNLNLSIGNVCDVKKFAKLKKLWAYQLTLIASLCLPASNASDVCFECNLELCQNL